MLDALFYLGGGSAYFGIGLRLRFMDVLRDPGLHLGVAIIQFAVQPLLAFGAVYGLGTLGWPATELQSEVTLIEAFSPVAINTVIVANLFRLDARLAAALWLSNTVLFCVIPLPALLWYYG